MEIYYAILEIDNPYCLQCFTDDDGKARAEELVEIHNKFSSGKKWYVVERAM
jgi:hypothetical protein